MSNLDPRAASPERITPPEPLPHVSRRALMRVKDWMPPPDQCPYCTGPVELVNNSAIYYGKSYGKWPYVYRCKPCDAYVGLHPDTDLPLGTLADSPTREARKKAKAEFFRVMKQMNWGRSKAYAWLSSELGIPKSQTHFGMFDVETSNRAFKILKRC